MTAHLSDEKSKNKTIRLCNVTLKKKVTIQERQFSARSRRMKVKGAV